MRAVLVTTARHLHYLLMEEESVNKRNKYTVAVWLPKKKLAASRAPWPPSRMQRVVLGGYETLTYSVVLQLKGFCSEALPLHSSIASPWQQMPV